VLVSPHMDELLEGTGKVFKLHYDLLPTFYALLPKGPLREFPAFALECI